MRSTGNRYRLFIIGGILAAVLLSVRYLLPLALPFLVGLAVAWMAEPLAKFLSRRAKFPRGLAAGTASIAALCIAYVAYIHGDEYGMMVVCLAMLALAGGCIGFLPFNFYPAKIFMGDGGSLFLGFMMAALSVVGPLKRSTVIAVVVPVIVLGIPIFDTFFAIVRRVINRRPIMEADKGHLHHKLMASGYGQRRAVLMLYGISAIMGMAAVLISRELYKDSFVLVAIAAIYLYVFLTDPNHKMPQIKAVNIAKEERKEEKQEMQCQDQKEE